MKKTGLITLEYVNTVIKERPRDIHKGDCGKVLVIAGSEGMAGAAMLCARGALRAGAGLVRISAPKELYPILQVGTPEATCVSRDPSSLDVMAQDAIAIGPGLGDERKNEDLIRGILKEYDRTIVLDADGLNAVSRFDLGQALKSTKANVIMTPHPGEAARLLKYAGFADEVMQDRQAAAASLSSWSGAVCVLKGSQSLVATASGDSYTNTTGNPGMATGGSGDVLTGIIAALAGQKLAPEDCARAGVFIHGMAGDLSAEEIGQTGMTAMDIANYTALAFKQIIGK
ncbi:MAG: NAD(P)H-hydrate dehydratase [Firmicutes bacterium]|nr:NAD(P)H-hydrate dehydratase [Bacillota bacterium]